MTEQPIERPLLGLTHKRHKCGALPVAAMCGYMPEEAPHQPTTPGADKYFTPIPDTELCRYQDCIVCTELWGDARVLGLVCGRCGERIRP